MAINEIINFSIKTLNGEIKNESATLNLKVPTYYNSTNLVDKSNYVIYRAFQTQSTNERQGTTSTKTRAEVRGGGRKPWKQKGTGRARAGSNRSPLWKGGGVTFGPKPKDYSQKINRKEWRLSLRLLLLKKQDRITVVDNFTLESFKTKDLEKIILDLGKIPSEKLLIIVPKVEENLRRASKNLKMIRILQANCLNIKDLLLTKSIIITSESLKIIEETYNNA
jgi:large subunit ribosomal protein L4